MAIGSFLGRLLRRGRNAVKTRSSLRRLESGTWLVDVRGQTCPGYLLDINRHVRAIGCGARVRLLVSYPPCAADVRAWCTEKGYRFRAVERVEGHCEIVVET